MLVSTTERSVRTAEVSSQKEQERGEGTNNAPDELQQPQISVLKPLDPTAAAVEDRTLPVIHSRSRLDVVKLDEASRTQRGDVVGGEVVPVRLRERRSAFREARREELRGVFLPKRDLKSKLAKGPCRLGLVAWRRVLEEGIGSEVGDHDVGRVISDDLKKGKYQDQKTDSSRLEIRSGKAAHLTNTVEELPLVRDLLDPQSRSSLQLKDHRLLQTL